MLGRRYLLVSVALVALMGIFAVVSFNDNSAEVASAAEPGSFDVAAALESAAGGSTVTLDGDATLLRSVTIRPEIVLDDNGFSLTIPAGITLKVEGTFVSTGNLIIEYRGVIAVSYGGLITVDGNTAEIAGSLEVYYEGVANIGHNESCILEMQWAGRLLVEGTMNVGYETLNSYVNLRNGTITGKLNISDGSVFKIYETLTIGSAPALITDQDSRTKITGVVTLDSTAGILVYGVSDFGPANIKFSSAKTVFTINGNVYATEYKDLTGKRTLTLPSTSNLRDWTISEWKAGNTVVTNDSNIQIGAYETVSGTSAKRNYIISFIEDKSIIWRVNGIDRGSSFEEQGAYDAPFSVSIRPAPGYTDQPVIFVDGVPSTAGVPQITVTIKGNTIFTTSNHYVAPSESLVPILLVILGVMIVILALALAALIMKNKKKQAT